MIWKDSRHNPGTREICADPDDPGAVNANAYSEVTSRMYTHLVGGVNRGNPRVEPQTFAYNSDSA
jgi:hypothetical protein